MTAAEHTAAAEAFMAIANAAWGKRGQRNLMLEAVANWKAQMDLAKAAGQ